MSDANNEISKTVYPQVRTALGLTLGLACSIPLSTGAALAAGADAHIARHTFQPHNFQLSPAQMHRAERRSEKFGVTNVIQNAAMTGANFNLSSSQQIFQANNLGNFKSLTIDVGGTQKVVGLDTKLTAAEVVAAQQVLSGGVQTIELRGNGAAAGGTINLNSSVLTALDKSAGGSISSLTIARGVDVIDSTGISLAGSLRNLGTISTASDASGQTITISADTINNARNASIGSYTGLDHFSADVALNAATSLTNNGSISSAGNLTITAPVINNVSAGSNASLSAGQSVNLNTQSLVNSGQIAAAAGDINVASTTILNVVGTAGTMQANSGNINFASNNADINITGGDLLSQQVNATAGTGTINATVGQATGLINAEACVVHFNADTANLNLGNIDASGDPLVTNVGNIVLNQGATAGGPLTIIAGGNITSAAAALSTAGAAGGGNLTLIAGAAFKTVGTDVNVTKKSSTGGLIDLTGATAITTNGGTGTAGDITLIAYAGKGAGTGSITLPIAPQVDATGATANGNVQIIAGIKSGTAVNVGSIKANNISITSAAPVESKGGVTYDGTTGALKSGTFSTKTLSSGTINLNNTLDGTGDITIATGTKGTVNAVSVITGSTADTAQKISITGGTVNLNSSDIFSNDQSSLTINTPQALTVNGMIEVGTFNLSAPSLDIASTGSLRDVTDNLTIGKGGITNSGDLGRDPQTFDPTRAFTTFNIVSGGTFLNNVGAVVSGDGLITATTFTNDGLANGNTTYTASNKSGILFDNKGTVDGRVVTINAVKGSILNEAGAFLQATQQTVDTDVPTLKLNTLAVNNLGHIEAVGELKRTTGTLDMTSTKNLTITGVDGGFFAAFNSSVNLTATKGNIIIGGNNGVINSNPFSALATGLGAFSATSKGTFESTMPGVSVTTDGKGKLGTVAFNVKNIVYNGLGTAPNFNIKSVGDPLTKAVAVLNLTTTNNKGITIGNGAGQVSVDLSGFDSTSTASIVTKYNLGVDSTALKLGTTPAMSTSLTLTGTKNLLITGKIDAGDIVTINTASKKPFQIGDATKTGITGLAMGEGITANKTITINAPGAVVMSGGAKLTTSLVLGTVNLNGPSLQVQSGSDITALNINLTTSSTKSNYTNLNANGALSGAHLNISTPGTLTLNSGGGNAVQTFLSMGNDISNSDPTLHSGGTFNLKAASLAFSKAGVMFNVAGTPVTAPSGGTVDLTLSTTKAVRIGLGTGSIRADVSNFVGAPDGPGAGNFRVISAGQIVATDVLNGAVKFGNDGGGFALISTTSTVTAQDVSGYTYNLFQLQSTSTQSLLATNATKNGVVDQGASIFGGNIVFDNNTGQVVTNGADLSGVTLQLLSDKGVDVRKNPSFTAFASGGVPPEGGSIVITTPSLLISGTTGLLLSAHGSSTIGGSIVIDTSSGTQALTIATPGTGGALALDVGITAPDKGGSISVKSGGALNVDGFGLNFGTAGIKESSLTLSTAVAVAPAKGSAITFSDANSASLGGLKFGTVEIDSGSTGAFKMDGASPNGNGFVTGNISAGHLIIDPAIGAGSIDTTGYKAITNDLDLKAGSITFANQTISVVADGAVGSGDSTGTGGSINIQSNSFNFSNAGGATLQALGTGGTGGSIKINQQGTQKLAVNTSTFKFDVTNTGMLGGAVDIETAGDMTFDGATLTYGAAPGNLTLLAAGNALISNIANISTQHLNLVQITTSGSFAGGQAFEFGSANKNGFVDVNPNLIATNVTIESDGTGAGVDVSTGTVTANNLTLKTSGALNIASGGTLSVVPSTFAGNLGVGGTLDITAAAITQSGGSAGYTLAAAGSTGAGGVINVNLTGGSALVIGAGGMSIDIHNANGVRGGSLTITSAGDITADINHINVGANFGGSGPNLSLNSKGILAVNNLTSVANIGLGGGKFETASIGGAPATGYTNEFNIFDPSLTTPGHEITITYVENPGDTNQQIANYFASQINNNPLLQNLGLTATVTGSVITVISNSNNTTFTETFTTPPLPASQIAPVTIGLISNTTGLTLTSQSPQTFLLGGAAAGHNGIQDNGLSLNIGAVTIANTGSVVTATIRGNVGAGTDSITVTDPGLPLGFVTVSTKTTHGESRESIAQMLADQINLNLDLENAGVTATVNGAVINIVTTGHSTVITATATGTKLDLATLSSGGNIQQGSLVNLAGAITDVISLTASGSIGTSSAAIIANGNSAESITLAAGANAYFSSTFGATSLNFNTVGHTETTFSGGGNIDTISGTVGDLKFLYTASTNNVVSIAGLSSTNGDLDIESAAQNLFLSGSLSSEFGNILVQNTNGGANANIQILSNSVIHGSGAVTALNQGNVYITIGLAPPAFTPADGTTPAGTTVIETGGANVTFGSTTFPAGTITADPTVIFQALGRNLVFSTDGLAASAITVGSNAIITADPPPPSSSAPIVGAGSPTNSSAAASNSSAGAPAIANTNLTNSNAVESAASNAVTTPVSPQVNLLGLPNLSINSATNVFSALTNINTVDLNNAQLSDLSSVGVATLNAVEAGNNAGLLSTASIGEIGSLVQTTNAAGQSATAKTAAAHSKTLIGEVSNLGERILEKGPLLLAPENDIVVKTPFGSINVAAKSLALIVASESSVAIYNLHDIRRHAVTMTSYEGHTFSVTPGTSAVLVSSNKAFEDVNPARFCKYRQPIAQSLNKSAKLYRAEFEIMSMMNGLPAFKDLMNSENKSTRKTMLQVLKTAAILMQMSGQSEPFKHFTKPEVTAFVNHN